MPFVRSRTVAGLRELLDGRLSVDLVRRLLRRERDPETVDLLEGYVARMADDRSPA